MSALAPPRESLAQQVGRVCSLDSAVLDRIRHEALTAPRDWACEYGEFQSGGWWTTSLYNSTGNPSDVTIADCDPVETSLLATMPATRDFLRSLGLRFMWVRLARLGPNSFLWEHRDYGELVDRERYRLHIPLQTNASAAMVVGDTRVHLSLGHLWRLVPTHRHGACNLLGPDRLHLICDCYGDEAFTGLAGQPALDDGEATELPAATEEEIARYVQQARRLVWLGYQRAAEHSLLRLFYRYAMPEGGVYDLVAEAYAGLDRDEDAATWRTKKAVMLGATHDRTGEAE